MDPEHFNLYCDRALYLVELERYPQAFDEIRMALAIKPESSWALSLLAECLIAVGQFFEAEMVARRAVDCDPQNFLAHSVLLKTLSCQGELGRECVECMERMLEEFPQNVWVFQAASRLQFDLHRYEDALQSACLGLEIDPRHIGCHRCCSQALFKLFRFQEAKKCLRDVLEIDPENLLAFSDLAWEEYNAGHLKEAEELFLSALRIKPESHSALSGLELVRNLL